MRQAQPLGTVPVQDPGLRQRPHQQRGGARAEQRRVAGGLAQHQVLQQELQVHQPALALLEVEQAISATVEFAAHARAHRHHVFAQLRSVAFARQGGGAHLLEPGRQRCVAGHAARAHQGLMLPGPGPLALVVAVAGQARDQQALAAVRTQAHVDVVQPPGAGHR